MFVEAIERFSAPQEVQSWGTLITQEQIGDALGLTSVHVNRSIRALRDEGVVRMSRSEVAVLDWQGLASIAEFDPAHLHLSFTQKNFEQPRGSSGPIGQKQVFDKLDHFGHSDGLLHSQPIGEFVGNRGLIVSGHEREWHFVPHQGAREFE